MSLTQSLNLRTPLVWVSTQEPGRVLDTTLVVEGSRKQPRDVYRVDALDGLLIWNFAEREWKQVLVDDPEAPAGVSVPMSLDKALPAVWDLGGVLIVENAHVVAEMLLNFFVSVHYRYRDTVFRDDLNRIPPQFIMTSHKEPPPEIARLVSEVGIELPEPDELANLTHMLYTTREQPNELEVDQIVRAGKGMAEGDFIAASINSLRDHGRIDPETINRIKLDMFKNQGLLELSTPNADIGALGGMDNLKELISRVSWMWHNPEQANTWDLDPLHRMLLVGVPGTGKSLAAKATASILGLDLAKGGASNAMSKWVGESEQNMRMMFKLLQAMRPIVFWIDEFGRDMSGSGVANDSGTSDRVHGEFLTGLQELPEDVFLVAAANRIDGLPPEMTRAERFDAIMFVGFPTHVEREEIFKIHLGKRSMEFTISDLADATPQFTGAEIQALIKTTKFKIGAGEQRPFNTSDLLQEIPNVRGRVWTNHRPAIIEMYERALREWDFASSSQAEEADTVLALAKPKASGPKQVGGVPVKSF